VVIVGAGLAGLSDVRRIESAGRLAPVLEARERAAAEALAEP
jgi:monoamine oxidase